MVKKMQKTSADEKAAPPLSSAVKDSAQQIWLAGLGAFSKVQEEGSKVFDTLVKEGLAIQRKTQAAAEEKITEATGRVSEMASDLQSKAGNRWDKLENIFEDRVAKALGKLGVPSAGDVVALTARIDQLDKRIQELSAKTAAPRASAARAATPKATKATANHETPQAVRPGVKRAAQKTARPAADGSPAAAQGASE